MLPSTSASVSGRMPSRLDAASLEMTRDSDVSSAPSESGVKTRYIATMHSESASLETYLGNTDRPFFRPTQVVIAPSSAFQACTAATPRTPDTPSCATQMATWLHHLLVRVQMMLR